MSLTRVFYLLALFTLPVGKTDLVFGHIQIDAGPLETHVFLRKPHLDIAANAFPISFSPDVSVLTHWMPKSNWKLFVQNFHLSWQMKFNPKWVKFGGWDKYNPYWVK